MRKVYRVVKERLEFDIHNSSQEVEAGPDASASFRFYQWIKNQPYDHLIFDECEELSYYTLWAIRCGLLSKTIELIPSKESFEIKDRRDFERYFLRQYAKKLSEFSKEPPRYDTRVSVCTPHHNRAESLKNLLNCLSVQTAKNFELVLVDDGSRADQLVMVRDLAKENWGFQVKLIEQDHLGARHARNRAANEASGEVLIFIDDDNYPRADFINTMVTAYQNTSCDILVSPFRRQFADTLEEASHNAGERERIWLPLGPCLSLGALQNVMGDMNALFNREFFLKQSGLKTDNMLACEDWEFMARSLLNDAALGVVPEILLTYRDHPHSFLKHSPRILSELSVLPPFLETLGLTSTIPFEIGRSLLAQKSENLADRDATSWAAVGADSGWSAPRFLLNSGSNPGNINLRIRFASNQPSKIKILIQREGGSEEQEVNVLKGFNELRREISGPVRDLGISWGPGFFIFRSIEV